MTCRGYDPKAVKVPKAIKTMASFIRDDHRRGDFIRGFVKCYEEDLRAAKKGPKSKE